VILLWCLVSQYPASDGSDWNEWNLEQTSIAADQSRQLVALTGAKVIDEKVDERMEIHLTPKDGSVIKLCLAVSHDMLAAGLVEAIKANEEVLSLETDALLQNNEDEVYRFSEKSFGEVPEDEEAQMPVLGVQVVHWGYKPDGVAPECTVIVEHWESDKQVKAVPFSNPSATDASLLFVQKLMIKDKEGNLSPMTKPYMQTWLSRKGFTWSTTQPDGTVRDKDDSITACLNDLRTKEGVFSLQNHEDEYIRDVSKTDPDLVMFTVFTSAQGWRVFETGGTGHVSIIVYHSNEQAMETFLHEGETEYKKDMDPSGKYRLVKGQSEAYVIGKAYMALLGKHQWRTWDVDGDLQKQSFLKEFDELVDETASGGGFVNLKKKQRATSLALLHAQQSTVHRCSKVTRNTTSSGKLKASSKQFEEQSKTLYNKIWWQACTTRILFFGCPFFLLVYAAYMLYIMTIGPGVTLAKTTHDSTSKL